MDVQSLRKGFAPVLVPLAIAVLLGFGYFSNANGVNAFVLAVGSKWVVLLEGSGGTVVLFLIEKFVLKNPISKAWYAAILLGFLFFGCFQAWNEERGVSQSLSASVNSASSGKAELSSQLSNKNGLIEGLNSQVTSQQTTIGELLAQIGKMQQKQPLDIRSFQIASRGQRPGFPIMEYILTTNSPYSPVNIIETCDFAIADTAFTLMTTNGGSASFEDQKKLSATSREIIITSPAWSPPSPLWISIFFERPVNKMPVCSFSVK